MIESIQSMLSVSWLYTLLAAIALGSTLVIIIVILSENRNPVKSLAWVTVLLLLPVVGLILYLFFGRSIKNTRMISRRNRRKLRRRENRVFSDPRQHGLSIESVQQINLGRSLTGAQFYPGNSVEVFDNGAEKFEALKADLRSAKRFINIQYYIFEDDALGNEIAGILMERAAAGVKVRLIYDHVGSFHVKSKFFKLLRKNGVEAYPFFKVSFPRLGTRINWRNHRKVVVIDNIVGYIGGMNVAQRYIDGGSKFDTWRDTHLRVTGPAVAALQYSFAVDWNFMGRGIIDNDDSSTSQVITGIDRPGVVKNVNMQLITSGPMSQWANVALSFHKAIANARRRVFIETPYFLPTEALLTALQSAALAHVDVRIIIPKQSDSRTLTHASASYISECLKSGIKIYRYTAGMLHSKMILVDDEFASIGSTNFDFRSFEYNFEANMFMFSREFNEKVSEIFKADFAQSERVYPSKWRHRPLKDRAAESVLRLLAPVL